jgi:hypothetical protein
MAVVAKLISQMVASHVVAHADDSKTLCLEHLLVLANVALGGECGRGLERALAQAQILVCALEPAPPCPPALAHEWAAARVGQLENDVPG